MSADDPIETIETVVIMNPNAGADGGLPPIAERLARLGPVSVHETKEAGHAERIAANASRCGVTRVVAVGGDGTIHEVVNGLGPESSCGLGIVPDGTGNDTARSLRIPLDLEKAVELIVTGATRPVDLIEVDVDGHAEVAINAVTGGFGGEVAERTTREMKERWGALAYLRTAADALSEIPCHHIRIEVDGASQGTLPVYSAVVANGPFAAHGVSVAPGARPDDGKLDLHVVTEAPFTDLLRMVPALMGGNVPESEHYHTWRGAEVVLETDEDLEVSVDGELRSGRRFRFRVLPACLHVHRP